ncbi:redoxin domain-containing protein [bacterium]|nr:MAG: redoxin domain-containing protein [bacterium]
MVAYWTFACSNCDANIPSYARLLAKYRPKGVEMISVHGPQMKIERNLEGVKKHIAKYRIDYPVVIDNDNANWNRWHVLVWPTLYVVDGEAEIGNLLDGPLAAK